MSEQIDSVPIDPEAYDNVWESVCEGHVVTMVAVKAHDEDVGDYILVRLEATDEAGDVVSSVMERWVR